MKIFRFQSSTLKKPDMDAQIVANQIANQIANRASFRMAQKEQFVTL